LGLVSAAAVSLAYGSTFVQGARTAAVPSTDSGAGAICARALSPERDLPANDVIGCQAAAKPGDAKDLAALNAQLLARQTAPFGRVAPGAYASAVAAKQALGVSSLPGAGYGWVPAGPAPLCDGHTTQSTLCPLANNTNSATASNGDYTISALGHKTLSGRITSFANDPANPMRIFAAPAMGGVYETTDAGTTWHSIGDSLPTQTMGAVAYDAPLHRIFAGTGDNAFGGSSVSGLGTFYSDDNGATWRESAGIPEQSLSFRIVPSPADSSGNTVYAASSRGLFRSDNGGASFYNENLPSSPTGYTVPDPTQGNKQVPCDGNTTAPLCFFANIVTDVVVKKSASANAPAGAVMAVLGWRAGNKINTNPDGTNNTTCQLSGVATPCLQAAQNGLYQSDSGKVGSFAYKAHTGTPQGMDFPDSTIVGRTTLGIADGATQNNDAVFALVQDAQKLQHCVDVLDSPMPAGVCNGNAQGIGLATVLDGAYATYDFGKSWIKVMDYTQLRTGGNTALIGVPGYGPGVQSWYNNWIKPDPTATDSQGNPTRVIFGLEEIWENNLNVPTVLSQPYIVPTNQGVGAASPWIVIGRYWNDCGGLNATGAIVCNPTANDNNPTPVSTTHPDQHAYLFVPDGSGGVTLFAGNDGGAFKQHVAAGADFTNANWGDGVNVGLYTLQPYDAEIAKDGTIVAGLQDNGEMKIAPNGQEAHTIFGGDGFISAIDPNNSQNILEEYAGGVASMSLNGGKDWWNVDPACASSQSQFSNAIEQDPTMPGHVVEGCTQIQEAGGGTAPAPANCVAGPTDLNTKCMPSIFTNPCAVPPGADPYTCQIVNTAWTSPFDLGYASSPGSRPTKCQAVSCGPFNIPSALGVRGESIYVGYCGYCDVVTGGVPFNSGIATNVGGSKPPAIGQADGWHFAGAKCAGCGTPNGLLPKRFITSIQSDPVSNQTVYVTLGGYGRRWIPPGALGDDVSNVGVGHVFVSHDAGEHFTDISGNLPDLPANYTLIHNGQLVVATDAGVYIASDTNGRSWSSLGKGLPNAPVFTIRLQPGNPDRMIAATYGRGVWQYSFVNQFNATGAGVTPTGSAPTTTTGGNGLAPGAIATPNTSGGSAAVWPAIGALALLVAVPVRRRRNRRGRA
jgi:hypothetical protein